MDIVEGKMEEREKETVLIHTILTFELLDLLSLLNSRTKGCLLLYLSVLLS